MKCNGCDDGLCRLGQSLSNKGYTSNFEQDKSIVIAKCTDVCPTKLLRVESKREDSRGILSTNVGVKTAKKDSLQLVRRDRACTGIRNSVHHVLELDDGKLTEATLYIYAMTYSGIGLKELGKRLSSSRIVANLNELHTHTVGVVVVTFEACGGLNEHFREFKRCWIIYCLLIRGQAGKSNFNVLGTPSVMTMRSRGLILPYASVPLAASSLSMWSFRILLTRVPVGVLPMYQFRQIYGSNSIRDKSLPFGPTCDIALATLPLSYR